MVMKIIIQQLDLPFSAPTVWGLSVCNDRRLNYLGDHITAVSQWTIYQLSFSARYMHSTVFVSAKFLREVVTACDRLRRRVILTGTTILNQRRQKTENMDTIHFSLAGHCLFWT